MQHAVSEVDVLVETIRLSLCIYFLTVSWFSLCFFLERLFLMIDIEAHAARCPRLVYEYILLKSETFERSTGHQ